MTAPIEVARPPGAAAAPGTRGTGPPASAIWRAVRLPVAVGLLALIGAVVIGVTNGRYHRGALDPQGVDPPGSRAVAVLLGGRGVAVHRVEGIAAVLGGAGPDSTIFLPFPDREPTALLARLPTLPATVRLVLVAPSSEVLAELSTEVQASGGGSVGRRDPRCADPVATTAGDADLGGASYTLAHPEVGSSCYGESMVVAPSRTGQALVAVGAPDPFTNDRLAQRGNAALALGLLGGAGDLWWVLPDPNAGVTGQHRSLLGVLPGWVVPVLWELALATLLLALWRGRRLGPVITESLPVVVRAAESVEGRARLYRRARARDRAAESLRGGAQARLTRYLGLAPASGSDGHSSGAGGRSSGPASTALIDTALIDAVSAQSGRPTDEVRGLLSGDVPTDDAGLVRLADSLDQIVRSTLDPGAHRP